MYIFYIWLINICDSSNSCDSNDLIARAIDENLY